jgi:PAS domain S-box-containing protein
MTHGTDAIEPQTLMELAWTYAPGSMFAFDATSGKIVDVNPAAIELSGYPREELLHFNIDMAHPEAERARVRAEFLHADKEPTSHPGLHLQRKDGVLVPVVTTASKSLILDGRAVVIAVYRDISELVDREHRLATKRWALSAYAGAAAALWQKHSPETLLEAICQAITRESVYVLAWVGIAENGPGKPIRVAAASGSALGYLDGLKLSWAEDGPAGHGATAVSIRSRQLQMVEDTETSLVYAPWAERARPFGIRSALSIPFASNGGANGALVVYSARPNAFEPVAIEVFQHLAEEIGHGLHGIDQERMLLAEREQLAKAERQLTEALSAMVAPIVTAMEMRDPYTSGHQSRVADIACAIATELGWSEGRIQGLRVASVVHDIGKISIPAEVLTKPTKLTKAEREMINGHPETAYTILKDIPFAWPIAEIVRQHHEKLDGSGYPFGLKGDAILPESRVLTVADIVEAMSSFRPYRPPIPMDIVLKEIENEAETRLDPEVVRVCIALFREKRFVLTGFNPL